MGDTLNSGIQNTVNPAVGEAGRAGTVASTDSSDANTIDTYTNYLPNITSSANGSAESVAGAATGTQANQQPILDALNLQESQNYAVPQAQVGQNVSSSNTAAENALLNGVGGQTASSAQALNQKLNPNYYNTLGSAATGAQQAINAINLNGLSPGEANATQRSLNQTNIGTGNLGLLNPINTISNALNFGGAFNSKIGLMNNAVNSATGVANAASGNAGLNPVSTALGQANIGTTFTNPTETAVSSPSSVVSNASGPITASFLNTIGSTTNANLQPLATSAYQNSTYNAEEPISTGSGSLGCCFIFLEANNGMLPDSVRKWRDYYYKNEPYVAIGYKRMAKVLVPLMRYSLGIKSLVNKFMVQPITQFGEWLDGKNTNGKQYYIYKKFWFAIWKLIGGF